MGPYLIQYQRRIYWITTCTCGQRQVHGSCLAVINTTTDKLGDACGNCGYNNYRIRWRLGWVRVMVGCAHLLSLASVLGLVYGLSFLGRSLDQLGLGNEMGAKLDGDENWQDHEMQEIADWLNLVHFVTALAGEALLGLVYVVGVSGIIGSERTLQMIHAILYLDVIPRKHSPGYSWLHCCFVWMILISFGLVLGTYLLFYSWVWACVFHLLCRRILNVQISMTSMA
ncbi:uncharacterized protein BX664DRAFT_321031 [Halteromyces radiatus]|uniref:uncharacterized protein n=1 Tax=Halteromyces radiatus TaxID=101107 RepID=UPI00221E3793|nr:uncharacterized protein BX664DRAFT_321031 [Halteromyces radiatus]KAI8099334.1 hypothetical protein BX664DRAFT_321031 [Halteromyces radiatus]